MHLPHHNRWPAWRSIGTLTLLLAVALIGCRGQRHTMSLPYGLDNPFWAQYFKDANALGTFVMYDPASERWQFHNKARADSAFSPASTFKIFNSLVALQERVIASDSVVLRWDSVPREFPGWNQDHDMRSAFKASCVWFYQELARRIGTDKMDYWLYKVGYGNREMGAAIDSFWLSGSLRISALQQVEFLFALEALDLPFSRAVQENVHRLMLHDSGADWQLYGKTGWGIHGRRDIGWFVGFVRRGAEKRIFAMNMDLHTEQDLPQRIGLVRKILNADGLITGND